MIRMDVDIMIRRVWETVGKMREKTGTKNVVELRKDWTKWRSGWTEKRTEEINTHQTNSQSLITENGT